MGGFLRAGSVHTAASRFANLILAAASDIRRGAAGSVRRRLVKAPRGEAAICRTCSLWSWSAVRRSRRAGRRNAMGDHRRAAGRDPCRWIWTCSARCSRTQREHVPRILPGDRERADSVQQLEVSRRSRRIPYPLFFAPLPRQKRRSKKRDGKLLAGTSKTALALSAPGGDVSLNEVS